MENAIKGILAFHPRNLFLQAIGSLISTPDVPQTKRNQSIRSR